MESQKNQILNESYGESKKQRSWPDEEMRLKANLSYGEVRSSGATKVNMEANHSYGLAREATDLDKRVEYDYVDNELAVWILQIESHN